MRVKLKSFIETHPHMVALLLKVINLLNIRNRLYIGRGNQLICSGALLNGVRIHIEGAGNTIEIGDLSRLTDCRIQIYGSNNRLSIGSRCFLTDSSFWMEEDGNEIVIGEHTFFHGDDHLAALESTSIRIGSDCLFAKDVHFRTGDSHSVVDLQGKRVNPARSITIGDHCWLGERVMCLKGAQVASNSVVGAGTLVTKAFTAPHCALGGVPAKILKEGIDWVPECIPEK